MISLSFRPPLYSLVPQPENAIVVMPPLWPDSLHRWRNEPSLWLTSSMVFFQVPGGKDARTVTLGCPRNGFRTQTCFPPIIKSYDFWKVFNVPKPSVWGSFSTTNSKIKSGCYIFVYIYVLHYYICTHNRIRIRNRARSFRLPTATTPGCAKLAVRQEAGCVTGYSRYSLPGRPVLKILTFFL